MDAALDRYLRRELIQFYVFDFKEQEMDIYIGKARIALLPLAQDQEISGEERSVFTLPSLLCTCSFLILWFWIMYLIFCFQESATSNVQLVVSVL